MSGEFSTEQPPTRYWGPGWYPDHDNGGERWWNGQDWDRSRWRPPAGDEDRGPVEPGGHDGSDSPPSAI